MAPRRFILPVLLLSAVAPARGFVCGGRAAAATALTRRAASDLDPPMDPPPREPKYAKAGSVSEETYSVSPLESLEAEYWGGLSPEERKAEQKILVGLAHLGEGNMEQSLEAFDEVLAIKGPQAYVWQRGIPLYYLGEYESAAEYFEAQARLYVGRFQDAPTPELLWAAASRAQLGDPQPLRYGEVAVDSESGEVLAERNPVLRCARDLFGSSGGGGGGGEEAAEALGRLRSVTRLDATTGLDPLGRYFYGHFYCALWMDSVRRDSAKAVAHLARVVASPFGAPDDLFRKLATHRETALLSQGGAGGGAVVPVTDEAELWL